jgi:hypothetical protein
MLSSTFEPGFLVGTVCLPIAIETPSKHSVPDVDNLFYVISEDNWASVTIADHEKNIVRDNFQLLHM